MKYDFSFFLIISFLWLEDFLSVRAYTPEPIQIWNSGRFGPPSPIPIQLNHTYTKFSGRPAIYFIGISDFSLQGTGLIDINYAVSFGSTNALIECYYGISSDPTFFKLTFLMTNDRNINSMSFDVLVGVETINSFLLLSHSGWNSFSSSFGYKSLIYNVSYVPRDPSLFQSDMTASISFSKLLTTNNANFFNISLQILQVSKTWITFQLESDGSTTFGNSTVDIIIYSKSFRGSY